jgi:tripartite ATP-independent transporter DctM subunit
MNELLIGIIGLFALIAIFLTGIELAVGLGVVGFVGFAYIRGIDAAFAMVSNDFFTQLSSYSLTVIPLFVLMGQIAFNAGIARKLYDLAHRFLGHIPGGLGIATVAGATLFKAVCGSGPATVATFATVAIPEMDRFRYSKVLSSGTVASVGCLGTLIPPSVFLIIYGLVTEQSIGQLFLAGLVPGLVVAFAFMCIIFGWSSVDPTLGPKSEKYSWGDRFQTLSGIIGPFIIFAVIMGGFLVGFFTPTEAGSGGAFSVLVLALVQRNISWQGYIKAIAESLRTASMVLLLIATSAIFGHFLAVTKIPIIAGDWISGLPLHRHLIMVLMLLVYQLGGSFIDDLAFIILATPIFFPAVLKLGYDPIWFGIIMGLMMGVGAIIPPMAMNIFIVQNVAKIPIGKIYKGALPFLFGLIIVTALLFIFPQIALWLPSIYAPKY